MPVLSRNGRRRAAQVSGDGHLHMLFRFLFTHRAPALGVCTVRASSHWQTELGRVLGGGRGRGHTVAMLMRQTTRVERVPDASIRAVDTRPKLAPTETAPRLTA
jgi:hypothetical protein